MHVCVCVCMCTCHYTSCVVRAEEGVYLFEAGASLEISNAASAQPMHLFLGAGGARDEAEQEQEPWVKLLGHNGFIIASDQTEATAIMDKIGERGLKFSYKDME